MVDESTRQAMRQWTLVQPIVSSYVHAMVRDRSARDDLMQEIAIAVLDSYERFDPNTQFVRWAMGIARNQLRNYFRTQSRQLLHFDDELVASLAETFADTQSDELQHLEHLQYCLAQLDGRAKELCLARYSDNKSPTQIAQILGSTPNRISKTLQRIREKLRECILRRSRLQGEA
jgi:RNA polymerase sigma-70 factor (ECF subfamily)